MNGLPSERGDPLGVAAESIADGLASLGIPKPDLSSAMEVRVSVLLVLRSTYGVPPSTIHSPCCPYCPSLLSSPCHPTQRKAAIQCGQ